MPKIIFVQLNVEINLGGKMDRTEFLKRRKKYICGTDIAAILGEN